MRRPGRNRNHRFKRRREFKEPRKRIDEVLKTPEASASVERKVSQHCVNTSLEINAEYAPALFTLFPELGDRLAWVSLRGTSAPAVPKRLVRSQHLFGPNYLFMKQEELDFYIIPENSARKLEFIMGDALRRKRRKFVSSGFLGSHHCLSVVKAAHEMGLKSEVVLKKCPLTSEALQMVGAMEHLGASVKLRTSDRGFQFTQKWQNFWAKLFRHEIVPPGGFTTKGVLGYANAMCELKLQMDEGLVPAFDVLTLSIESGSTLVGLEIGRRLAGLDKMKIAAFQTAETERIEPTELVSLAEATVELLNRFLDKPLQTTFLKSDFQISTDYIFDGYGIIPDFLTRWENEFIELEGIELGENSSLKALYGLSDQLRKQNITDKKILFWNTFCPFRLGDLPDHFNYSQLSWRLKRWVREEQKLGRLPEVGRI